MEKDVKGVSLFLSENHFFAWVSIFQQNPRKKAAIFLTFFLNFISLISLIFYLITFNTSNKCHFLNNGDIGKKLKFTQFYNF